MVSPVSNEPAGAVPDIGIEHGLQKTSSYTSQNKEAETAKDATASDVRENAGLDVSLPLNWPIRKKVINMAVPSFICFVV